MLWAIRFTSLTHQIYQRTQPTLLAGTMSVTVSCDFNAVSTICCSVVMSLFIARHLRRQNCKRPWIPTCQDTNATLIALDLCLGVHNLMAFVESN
jgi:hypothetical protein